MKKVICLFACLLSFNVGAVRDENANRECMSPRWLSIIVASKSMDLLDCHVVDTPVKKDETPERDCPVVNTPVKKDKNVYSVSPERDCPVSPIKGRSPVRKANNGLLSPELDCHVPNSPVKKKTPVKDVIESFSVGSPSSVTADDLELYIFQLQSKK